MMGGIIWGEICVVALGIQLPVWLNPRTQMLKNMGVHCDD